MYDLKLSLWEARSPHKSQNTARKGIELGYNVQWAIAFIYYHKSAIIPTSMYRVSVN